jgi:diguanylate cyclase (GGDEF)-like protein
MLDLVHHPQSPRFLVEPALLATRAPSFAILLIRLNRSQSFQELIGPRYANAVLNVGINRIKATLSGKDSLLRIDKDELIVLLNPIHSADEAKHVADTIISELERPYFCRGKSAQLSVSVGIALAPQNGKDVDSLLQCATSALRCASAEQRGMSVIYDGELQSRSAARRALAADLLKALDPPQLELRYQPRVSIDGRRLNGFGTALCWRHPSLGLIPSAKFEPLAEEIGMIDKIADWTLRTACVQTARLRPDLVVAVKAYPSQFLSGSLLASVTSSLSQAGLPPGLLALEVTEDVFLNDLLAVQSTIASLHAMGVKIVLDNFGKSFSFLDQLTRFPFHGIKIDSSLVGGTVRQRAMVRAAAMIGRELGISILAQGVDTAAAIAEAEQDGCTSVEGDFFGKATSVSMLDEVITQFEALA